MNSAKRPYLLALGLLCSAPLLASTQIPSGKRFAESTALRPQVFGAPGMSAAQLEASPLHRFDGSLIQISQAASGLSPETALSALHTLNPAVHFRTSAPHALPEVLVDVVANDDVETLKSQLVNLGLENAAVFSNDVGGWLPVDQLASAAELPQLRLARASRARTRTGAVTSQGDFAQRSDVLRAMSSSFDGRGVTVGVLSDSFNCYAYYEKNGPAASGNQGYAQNGFEVDAAKDESSGDLTSTVNVLAEGDCGNYGAPQYLPFTDEGRAILQIIHDVAPGAALAFYTADNSEADFAHGIVALANAGAKVIDDDVGYEDEPFFQDGMIAQAIDQVEADGVAYFSSAGNDGRNSYENSAPQFPVTTASGTKNAGEKLLNFDTSGKTTTTQLPITIPELVPGEYLALVVEWDQPYVTGASGSPGSANALDLCMTDGSGNIQSCSGANAVGGDPVLYLIIGNPANASGNSASMSAGIEIGLAKGAVPGLVKFALLDDGAGGTINSFATASPTLQGHPGAAGAAAVGAAFYNDTPRCGTTPAQLESYSSAAGDPILFDVKGNRLASPVVRQKPDFVATDGGNDTFLGFVLGRIGATVSQCENNLSYPNFFGTSAAAPHAAAVAALFLQAKPTLTPSQIYSSLSSTALPMGGTSSFSYDSGTGFIQADAAFSELGLTAPTTTGGTTGGSTGGGTSTSSGGSTGGTTGGATSGGSSSGTTGGGSTGSDAGGGTTGSAAVGSGGNGDGGSGSGAWMPFDLALLGLIGLARKSRESRKARRI